MSAHERQLMYYAHRLRVQNAKSIVNSQAPQRKLKVCDPMNREVQLLEMLSALRCRSSNTSRTFTKSPEVTQWRSTHSNISHLTAGMGKLATVKRLECQANPSDHNYCCRCQSAELCVAQPTNRRWNVKSKNKSNHKDVFGVPEHVINRYSHLVIPRGPAYLRKLLRPKIYLDVEVKGYRPLGRMIIQLYTEACPNVVLEFVRACLGNRSDFFTITRLFTPLWLEGELAMENSQALSMPNMEHDTSALDHGSGSGILSFPSRYLRGSKRRFLNFTISFKPLSVLNGKRVAFGKIRYGYRILETMQEFNTKNGRPTKEIVVKACGIVH